MSKKKTGRRPGDEAADIVLCCKGNVRRIELRLRLDLS